MTLETYFNIYNYIHDYVVQIVKIILMITIGVILVGVIITWQGV